MAKACDLLCIDLPTAEAIRAKQLRGEAAERGAAVAQALADPTRLGIAAALAQADELCGCDLAWITGRSQKLVSHHLKVLRSAGLVSSRREGKIILHELSADARALLEVVLSGQEAHR
ncbi:MAG: metalloregulator ArsR/SmtB family transcription factor [Actinomycetota bacterium]|nr:metalloregulator ArsR/SmtB family transcription factor [Actinomycetota bacterium]